MGPVGDQGAAGPEGPRAKFGDRGAQFGIQGPNWGPGSQVGTRVHCALKEVRFCLPLILLQRHTKHQGPFTQLPSWDLGRPF